jgi:uncharacterized protein
MALTLTKNLYNFLKARPEELFTARDIANWIFLTYPEQCREKQERSTATITPLDTDEALIQQLVREIGSQRPKIQQRWPEIKTMEGRPRRFYYSTLTDEAEVASKDNETALYPTKVNGYSESELYPIVSEFLWRESGIYSKRIDEKRSHNTRGAGGNRWLFPDIVGLEDLSQDWNSEIKSVVQEISDQNAKLWSFEVKKHINKSNVREAYFQAVSNSSWANFGYLIAAEIQGQEAEKELRILSGLHGIGVIILNTESPAESEIMIPAREKINIDWNAANRLAQENSDFLEYIRLIRQFYQTGEHRPKDWDIPQE